MDPMIISLLIEFLEVAIHNILFLTDVYPKEIFENRKKYGAPVKYSVHPQVNDYIVNCLSVVKELVQSDSLDKVVLSIVNENAVEIQKFVFEIGQIQDNPVMDPYLIRLEESMRAYCLKLSSLKPSFIPTAENSTFSILMHTNESTAVNLVSNSEMEHFPLIEKETDKQLRAQRIVPISSVNINGLFVQTYAEN